MAAQKTERKRTKTTAKKIKIGKGVKKRREIKRRAKIKIGPVIESQEKAVVKVKKKNRYVYFPSASVNSNSVFTAYYYY